MNLKAYGYKNTLIVCVLIFCMLFCSFFINVQQANALVLTSSMILAGVITVLCGFGLAFSSMDNATSSAQNFIYNSGLSDTDIQTMVTNVYEGEAIGLTAFNAVKSWLSSLNVTSTSTSITVPGVTYFNNLQIGSIFHYVEFLDYSSFNTASVYYQHCFNNVYIYYYYQSNSWMYKVAVLNNGSYSYYPGFGSYAPSSSSTWRYQLFKCYDTSNIRFTDSQTTTSFGNSVGSFSISTLVPSVTTTSGACTYAVNTSDVTDVYIPGYMPGDEYDDEIFYIPTGLVVDDTLATDIPDNLTPGGVRESSSSPSADTGLLSLLQQIWAWLQSFFTNLTTSVLSALNSWWDSIKNWWLNLINSIISLLSDVKSILQNILASLGGFLSLITNNIGKILALISGYTLFQSLFTTFLPSSIASIIWAFWVACLCVWLFRLILDR